MQTMQQKRSIYYHNDPDRIPITRTNIKITKKPKQNQFDFSRISQIDQLLTKNQQIYKNLRKKLEDISQAERNITKNINVIRPFSYGTRQKEVEVHQQNYERFLNDSDSFRTNNFDNFASSSIQTERLLNESLRRRIEGQNILVVSEQPNVSPIVEQQAELKQSNIQSSIHHQPSLQSNFKRTNTSKNRIYLQGPIILKNDSSDESSLIYNNIMNITSQNNRSQKNLPENSSFFLDKENIHGINRSYEPLVDSVVRMNFFQLSKRKAQIENIYQNLKKEEEEIEKSYQEYKKSFNQMSTKKEENIVASMPPKSSPTKKGFQRKSSPSINASKMSSISKNNQSIANLKQTKSSVNKTKKNHTNDANLSCEILQKSEYSPVKMSMMRYCTQQFQVGEIPSKPKQMTARSHVFVPFNKLYKSPIIQMKNKNTLILARQSKQLSQKTSQHKIIDGKKYKFPQNIETDQQQLIRNVLKHDHNIIAIVGGQQTLKKKLHMSIIAHSVDRILKAIHSQQRNCLSVSLSYQEYTEKEGIFKVNIRNEFDITIQTSIKMVALELEKTVEEIYEAIKRPHALLQSTGLNKSSFQLSKDRTKVVKFTKLSLLSGKDLIWACHILSSNQVSFQFLKNLQAKDIIWSINPLIKNYDEVAKTLNQANKYIEARIDM